MEKLRGAEGSNMDMQLVQLKSECLSSDNSTVEEHSNPETKVNIKNKNGNTKTTSAPSFTLKPVRFTKKEDDFIKRGSKKFGPRWCSVLHH